jgi:predicted aconitase with swiveling domain
MEVKGMSERIRIKGRKVYGGIAEGEALVSKKPLMGWGNVNVKQGFTVERGHPLF